MLHILTKDFNCRLNIVCFVSSKDELNLNLLTEAMDRIHRLGQRRPVQAIKLVVEDSIESRIVQVSFIQYLQITVANPRSIASREKKCNG